MISESSERMNDWRNAIAVGGFLCSFSGVLISSVLFRLVLIIVFAHDFLGHLVELWGLPFCVVGFVLSLFGPSKGWGAWLSRISIVLATVGILIGGFLGLMFLTWDGGAV